MKKFRPAAFSAHSGCNFKLPRWLSPAGVPPTTYSRTRFLSFNLVYLFVCMLVWTPSYVMKKFYPATFSAHSGCNFNLPHWLSAAGVLPKTYSKIWFGSFNPLFLCFFICNRGVAQDCHSSLQTRNLS